MKVYRHVTSDGKIRKDRFTVAIFGSARIKNDRPMYKKVYNLAKMLGERDMDVVTGGGPGLMEAANTGHKLGSKKTNAHSIGLGIKLPKEQKFNSGVDEKETFMRFTNRLDNFMLLSNAVVVASGGVGTLLELFYTWQLVQVKHICNIPIILYGDMWPGLLEWLKKGPLKKKYFDELDYNMLFYAKTEKEAIELIDKAYEMFKNGGDDFCVNEKKYGSRVLERSLKKK